LQLSEKLINFVFQSTFYGSPVSGRSVPRNPTGHQAYHGAQLTLYLPKRVERRKRWYLRIDRCLDRPRLDHGVLWRQHERANDLKWKLIELAAAVLVAAITTATLMTWRKARKSKLPVWDHTSRRLTINMLIPLITGGLFVVGLLYRSDWEYVAPSCLIFYGLALVNASKYTLTDIRYLGLLEIALGCVCMYYPHDGLYFWAVGFGVLHIVYGLIMWWKYEKS
jgi:hypothetical protein